MNTSYVHQQQTFIQLFSKLQAKMKQQEHIISLRINKNSIKEQTEFIQLTRTS